MATLEVIIKRTTLHMHYIIILYRGTIGNIIIIIIIIIIACYIRHCSSLEQ